MGIWAAISKHRTKILGGIQVGAGAIMTQLPQFQAELAPVHYGLIVMVLGTSTAILGFINSSLNNRRDEPPP